MSSCPGRRFVTLGGIRGRTEDTLRLFGRNGTWVEVNPLAFHNVLDTLPVSGWQIVEEADGLRVLLAGVSDGLGGADAGEALARALDDLGVVIPSITVENVPTIPKTAAGKTPLIKSYRARSLQQDREGT